MTAAQPNKTEFGIKAPRFWLFPPKLDFYLTLPGGRQLGPASLTGGLNVTGLPEGDYQLSGQFEGFDPFSIHIVLRNGEATLFEPLRGASLAQRRAFRQAQGQDGKSTILYLQRRKYRAAAFYLGHCDSPERLDALLAEGEDWPTENEAGETVPAMNEFAASQHVESYDPDLLEAGFETGGDTIETRFAAYSWAYEWAPELAFRATPLYTRFPNIENPNCLIMIGGDPDSPQDWLYGDLFDISAPGIDLHFMGIIRFSYYDGGPAGR